MAVKIKQLIYIPNQREEENRQVLIQELESRGAGSLIFDFLNDSLYVDIVTPSKATIGVDFMKSHNWHMPFVIPHVQLSNAMLKKFDYVQFILDQIKAEVANKILLLPHNATIETFKELIKLFKDKNFTVLVPTSMEREEIRSVLEHCVKSNIRYVDMVDKLGYADMANLVTITPEFSDKLIMGVRECWFHEAQKYDPKYKPGVLSIALYMKLGLVHFSRKLALGRGGSDEVHKFSKKNIERINVLPPEFNEVKDLINNGNIVKNYFRLRIIHDINEELNSINFNKEEINTYLNSKDLFSTSQDNE